MENFKEEQPGGVNGRENQEFPFEYVKLEMSIRHPCGAWMVAEEVGYGNLKFKEEVQTGGTNLRVASIYYLQPHDKDESALEETKPSMTLSFKVRR